LDLDRTNQPADKIVAIGELRDLVFIGTLVRPHFLKFVSTGYASRHPRVLAAFRVETITCCLGSAAFSNGTDSGWSESRMSPLIC